MTAPVFLPIEAELETEPPLPPSDYGSGGTDPDSSGGSGSQGDSVGADKTGSGGNGGSQGDSGGAENVGSGSDGGSQGDSGGADNVGSGSDGEDDDDGEQVGNDQGQTSFF